MTNTAHTASQHSLAWLALATGLLPLLVVNLSYIGSAAGGLVPTCVPYLQGCTSISASGRYGLAYFFFKAGMIPAAVLLAAYWVLSRRWLLTIGDDDSRMARVMVTVGCISAVFLILYTVFLGSKGDFYNLMRRFGVTIYFSFSVLAQMMLLSRLRRICERDDAILPGWVYRGKLILVGSLLLLGLGSIPISNFVADKARPENAVEWMFALLMVSYYFLSWRAWRCTGFAYTTSVTRQN